jgi:hypothetical protein
LRCSPSRLMTGHSSAGQAACGPRRGIRDYRASSETSRTLHMSMPPGR